MASPSMKRLEQARIPTAYGEFTLYFYESALDGKEHLALTLGSVAGKEAVLVRLHSECFTGDVLGSLRCDCGEQLQDGMRRIAREGGGAILYLRQEGRGIGLRDKLRAYNLQDAGHDTVEANLLLGHGADERDYTAAALMLQDLDIRSVRLLTNNPHKIESLKALGVDVVGRIPAQPHLNAQNAAYLEAKVRRMRHLLDLGPVEEHGSSCEARLRQCLRTAPRGDGAARPFVTLSYAQSLDGSIAAVPGRPFRLSGKESLRLTHELRAAHDAILVGIGTVLADDPRLTVRLSEGADPQPVVLDSHLRFPPEARLLAGARRRPLIATTEGADARRQRQLERCGAEVIRFPPDEEGRVDLSALLISLWQREIRSVMVEGGGRVITSFLAGRHVDHLVITFAAVLLGGLRAVGSLQQDRGDGHAGLPVEAGFPRLRNLAYQWLGPDLILKGDPYWTA